MDVVLETGLLEDSGGGMLSGLALLVAREKIVGCGNNFWVQGRFFTWREKCPAICSWKTGAGLLGVSARCIILCGLYTYSKMLADTTVNTLSLA